jgi:S-adenosylmethionine/arginine decarboxylase-like enzyme
MSTSCHIFIDYRDIYDDENELGEFIFGLMVSTILNKTCMKIVHQHLCILNVDTPPGFTSVLLLDTSHFTSHCYSKKGTLSCDLFTCNTDLSVLEKAIQFFINSIEEKYPRATLCNYKINFRHL